MKFPRYGEGECILYICGRTSQNQKHLEESRVNMVGVIGSRWGRAKGER